MRMPATEEARMKRLRRGRNDSRSDGVRATPGHGPRAGGKKVVKTTPDQAEIEMLEMNARKVSRRHNGGSLS
jgi:hypothetical protein